MSVISLLVEFLTILCLPLTAGQALATQSDKDSLQKLADSFYTLEGLKMSDDGLWLSVYKNYELNNDTVLILSSKTADKPVCFRTKVREIEFLKDNRLIMLSNDQAELLNLEDKNSISFKNVTHIQVLSSCSMFILQYNEKEQNKLELRDFKGKLLNFILDVNNFYISDKNNIYIINEDNKSKFNIALLSGESIKIIYTSQQRISWLKTDKVEQGLLIQEESADENSKDVQYLDLATNNIFSLKAVLPLSFQNAFIGDVLPGGVYFVKIQVQSGKTENSLVDIWYGSDNELERKNYPAMREVYYLWEPNNKRVQQIGNDELSYSISLGNGRYFLCYNPSILQDYTSFNPHLKLYVYDVLNNEYSFLDTITKELYVSLDGKYLITNGENVWNLIDISAGSKKAIPLKCFGKPWFTKDGNTVLFEGEGALWSYDLKNGSLSKVAAFEGFTVNIVNGISEGLNACKGNFSRNYISLGMSLVIRLFDPGKILTSYVLLNEGRLKVIVPITSDNIKNFNYSKYYNWFSWIEENYNKPPDLVYKQTDRNEKIIYKSNGKDRADFSLKQEIISYTNSDGVPLKGILYYPLNYDCTLKYPMVVHIYQVQSKKVANEYPVVYYAKENNDGFSLRLLLEKGYFVYFPDIVYGEMGTGLSALDCVNHSLDALQKNASIDKNKIGLIGHSHGGYETNFIATHSDRFAAYVSGAGNSDIVRSYFSFNNCFQSPFYWQFENGQYEMKKSFKEDKDLYFKNNPIYYVDRVNAPVLLWAGMKDQNIYWEQTMEFYIGLKRNNKKVIALFYPEAGHALFDPQACKDLVLRVMDWFDYFLKEKKNIDWIDKEKGGSF